MTAASKLMTCGRCGGHATVPGQLVLWTALGPGLDVVCPECLPVADNVAIADYDVVGTRATEFGQPVGRKATEHSFTGETRQHQRSSLKARTLAEVSALSEHGAD